MLKVAVVIAIIGTAYAGIYSLMCITIPKAMLGSTVKAVTGKDLDSIDEGSLKALLGRQRNIGLYALVAVICFFFILIVGFRKAEKWAWWAFLIGGGIAWLWGVIYALAIGNKLHILLQAIGIVVFIVAVLLPVKVFFAKAAEEAPQEAQ